MTTREIVAYATKWRSEDALEKSSAEAALSRVSADEVYAFLDWSLSQTTAITTENRLGGCGMAALLPIAMILLCAAVIMIFQFFVNSALMVGAVGVLAGHLAVLLWRRMRRYDPRTEAAVFRSLKDPATVDPLLSYLFAVNPDVRLEVAQALCRLLPRIENPAAGMLFPDSRVSLNRIITSEFGRLDPEFMRTAVESAAKLGDVSQLRALEALSKRQADAQWQQDIIDIAAQSLEVIKARVQASREPGMLLRPADSADKALLRPAPNRPNDSAALLRSAESANRSLEDLS